MGIDVRPEVTIARPRGEVAAFMFDPDNDAVWTRAVIEVRRLTDGPLRPGSRVERRVRFMGREFGYEYEVIDTDPESFLEMRVEDPFPMHVRYELADAPDGSTRAAIRSRGDARGFFKLASPLMARMVERQIRKDLELLKAHLEASARDT